MVTARWSPAGGPTESVQHELVLELLEEVRARVAAVGDLEELGRPERRPDLPADVRRPVAAHLVRGSARHLEALALLVAALLAGDDRADASFQDGEVLVLAGVVMTGREVAGA